MRGSIVAAVLLAASALVPSGEAPPPEPYVVLHHWDGFITCAAGTPIVTIHACSVIGVEGAFSFDWTSTHGLQEVVLGLRWEASSPLGDTLRLVFDDAACDYGEKSGGSPVVFQVEDGDIADPACRFSAITESRDMLVRVFPDFGASVVVDQPIEVAVEEYYFTAAPENRDPFSPLDG